MCRLIAGKYQTPAEQDLRAMAVRQLSATGQRHVGFRLAKPDRLENLTTEPLDVALARYGFDDETGERIAMIGIFQSRVRLDHRRQLEIVAELLLVRERGATFPVRRLPSVAKYSGRVREQLRDRRRGDVAMQSLDIVSDGIVNLQPTLLAQFQDGRCCERLGMRRNAK